MALPGLSQPSIPVSRTWPRQPGIMPIKQPDVSIPENPILRGVLTRKPQQSVQAQPSSMPRLPSSMANPAGINTYLKNMMTNVMNRVNPAIVANGPFYHLYRALSRQY